MNAMTNLAVLKWAGGKRHLAPLILPHIPTSKTLVEPFLGGGSIAFTHQADTAILADINRELIDTYRAIRDDPDSVIGEHQELVRADNKHTYYRVRAWDRKPSGLAWLTTSKRAARMLYLNKAGFGGLYRRNRHGHFNVPYNAKGKHPHVTPAQIRALSTYLNRPGVTLACGSFEDILTHIPPYTCFVFADPPYDGTFTNYTEHGFTRADQTILAHHTHALTRAGAQGITTNSDTPFIRYLYRDYTIEHVTSRYAIGRTASKELIIHWSAPYSEKNSKETP